MADLPQAAQPARLKKGVQFVVDLSSPDPAPVPQPVEPVKLSENDRIRAMTSAAKDSGAFFLSSTMCMYGVCVLSYMREYAYWVP